MNWNLLFADLVAIVHFAYVAFVVLGLLFVLLGYLTRWEWVRNKWFRLIHLGMILIVVVESLLGITCPLTTLENYFRLQGGAQWSERSFVGRIVHNLMFFEFSPLFFTILYCVFGSLVLLTFYLVPVRWRIAEADKA